MGNEARVSETGAPDLNRQSAGMQASLGERPRKPMTAGKAPATNCGPQGVRLPRKREPRNTSAAWKDTHSNIGEPRQSQQMLWAVSRYQARPDVAKYADGENGTADKRTSAPAMRGFPSAYAYRNTVRGHNVGGASGLVSDTSRRAPYPLVPSGSFSLEPRTN